jgi:Fe2+ or Zn2+ uptake regulation protein
MTATATQATKLDRQDLVAATLRASGYRVTSQRLVIAEELTRLDRHVSAEEVRAAVADRLPNVSLPTIYATLDVLEECGLVRRIAAGRERALFDAGDPGHHHMVCRRCGRVEDLEAPAKLSPALAAAADRGFRADGAEVVVRGLCARCAAR